MAVAAAEVLAQPEALTEVQTVEEMRVEADAQLEAEPRRLAEALPLLLPQDEADGARGVGLCSAVAVTANGLREAVPEVRSDSEGSDEPLNEALPLSERVAAGDAEVADAVGRSEDEAEALGLLEAESAAGEGEPLAHAEGVADSDAEMQAEAEAQEEALV